MAQIDPRIALQALPRRNALDYAHGFEDLRQKKRQGKQQQNELAMQAGTMLARGVLSAEDPAAAYPLALQQAQRFGMDVSSLPPEWGPEAEVATRMFAAGQAERTALQQNLEMLPPEQRLQAARVHFGLEPKAQGPEMRTLGNTLLEVGPEGARPIYEAPEKPDVREFGGDLVEVGPGGVKTIAEGEKGPDFDAEQKLRKEFTSLTKDFRTVHDAYGRIQASAVDPSPAGDLAMVFNFMKLLDPGSVVRESEFATAANAAGVPERIRTIYNRVLSGHQLGPNQREDFVNRAERLYEAQREGFEQQAEQYQEMATDYGINPERSIPDLPAPGSKPDVQSLSDEELMRMLEGQ